MAQDSNSSYPEQPSEQDAQPIYSFVPSASPLTNRGSWIAALTAASLLCLFLLGVTLNTRRNMTTLLTERARLSNDSQRLAEEAQRLQEQLSQIEQSKREAEKMRQDAEQARADAARTAATTPTPSGDYDAAHHRDLHLRLAQAYGELKRYDLACDEDRAIITLNSNDADAWGELGWFQYEMGKYADALQSSRKALDINDRMGFVRLNVGLIYAVQGNWTDAEQEYNKAVLICSAATLNAGIKDVEDALSANPDAQALDALQKSRDLLKTATPGTP